MPILFDMTDERGVPTACARCASLLTQGTTTCRICGWDMTGATNAPPAPPPTAAPAGGGQFGGYGQTVPVQPVPVQAGYGHPTAPGGFGHVPTAPGYPMARPYKAPLGLATAAMVLVGASAVVSVVTLLIQGAYASKLREARSLSFSDENFGEDLASAVALEGLYGLASMIVLVTLVAAGVVTICWSFQSRNHAATLGTHAQRYSGGWVVAGWLVPVISLFYPFRIVTDIWTANDPQHGRTPRGAIPLWWGTFIVSNLLSYASFYASNTRNGTTTTTTVGQSSGVDVTALDWIGAGLGIVAAVTFIHIVRTIRGWQQQPAVPYTPQPTRV